MNLETIKQYWEDAVKLSNDLQEDWQFSTTQFIAYLNAHLPAGSEEITKTKVNYLRTQGILKPEEAGEGEIRTSWRYTTTDARRAILVELLKAKEELNVQESRIWLQNLENDQNKGIRSTLEASALPQEITIPAPPTPASSAYALLRNRTLGTLLTALSFGEIEIAPPNCLIAIHVLNQTPETPQIQKTTWEDVSKQLEQGSWSLAVSDNFSKIYVYSDLPQLRTNQPDVLAQLSSLNWYVLTLPDTSELCYEIVLGLPKESGQSPAALIQKALGQRMTNNVPIQLCNFPGLATLLKVAFVKQAHIKEGTTLSVLAEIIAEASDAWNYCSILVPKSAEGDQAKVLYVQEYSSGFPESLKNMPVNIDKSLTGWCYRYQQPAIITSMAQNDLRMELFEEEGRPAIAAAVPAIAEELQVVGVVYVAGPQTEVKFSAELIACLQALGYICGDAIAREHIEIETVHNMSHLTTQPSVERFDSLDQLLGRVAETVREGVSPEKVASSWIYLLTLNIQTITQDVITRWLCQQGIDFAANFLASHLLPSEQRHPLPIGLYQEKPDQCVYAILQAVDLSEDAFSQCIMRLQKTMDQMRIGSLAPRFYPSGVTFRFKDLNQKLDETGFDEVVKALKERTRERLVAGLYFNRGQAALNAADLDQAVSEFEGALRYEPHSWYAHKHLAEARMLQGTPEAIKQAISHCHTAIEDNPAYASAHCLLADCLAYLGNFGEALFHYEEALALESTRSDFLIRYGLTLAAMSPDEYQEAIQNMQQMQEENQQVQPRAFHGQPWQAAIDKFDRARSLGAAYNQDAEKEREQRAKFHYQRGYAYLQANMLDKALENFTVGRKLAPDDLQLAQAYSYVLSLRRKEKTA